MTDSPLRAVLFDIDGTLVDSNYLHVDAWDRGLADAGIPAPVWRIHRSIGMDSKKLLEAVAGEASEEDADRAKELHSGYYKDSTDRLRPFEERANWFGPSTAWGSGWSSPRPRRRTS
ncbi:HAD family hydrolase [Naasia aerilata]|uniref:HAD family phosphatase n=1 Tax=Naasia aerilata TaxID=1162966 RepID=A0ABN6XNH0_9MICO|nr:HAD family hydrolase [Naasia aerilata]BDZ46431.1 hypothetical protein GCM10025866_23400 [Naasia aerilata]